MFPNSRTIPNISYSNLYFLTAPNTAAPSLSPASFNPITGKPLSNLNGNAMIDSFFLNTVKSSLSERVNINENFIYKYPQVLEVDAMRDLSITNETTINAVFVHEGAAMKNMFGYYFYYTDPETGNKHILDNDPENPSEYYYRPTVIFPNVTCEPGDYTTLQPGDTRLLKGNLPNGNFEHITIGFFLICFGWYAHTTETTINDDRILHTTIDFNHSFAPSIHQTINEKIYSVFVKSTNENGDELLLVGFEDCVFNNGDLDYNDCVIGIQASDVNNIENYDLFAEMKLEDAVDPTYNNLITLSDDGEYVSFKDSQYTINTKYDHRFERHMCFSNDSERDEMYEIFRKLKPNYVVSKTKTSPSKLVITYLFRKNDLLFSKHDDYKRLYLLDIKYNKGEDDDKDNTNDYVRFLQEHLLTYSEKYTLYEVVRPPDNHIPVTVIPLTATFDAPKQSKMISMRLLGSGLVDCKNGKANFPSKTRAIYQYYKSTSRRSTLGLNIKMDTHPTGYKDGHQYFIRYACFVSDNQHVVIDLGNLSLHQDNGSGVLTPLSSPASLNNFSISSISTDPLNIKELQLIKRNDRLMSYRTITIKNNITFYAIKSPTTKNNPTAIFVNSYNLTSWSDMVNTVTGTYFNKQRFYVLTNFIN